MHLFPHKKTFKMVKTHLCIWIGDDRWESFYSHQLLFLGHHHHHHRVSEYFPSLILLRPQEFIHVALAWTNQRISCNKLWLYKAAFFSRLGQKFDKNILKTFYLKRKCVTCYIKSGLLHFCCCLFVDFNIFWSYFGCRSTYLAFLDNS